jgi:hypothetical protein
MVGMNELFPPGEAVRKEMLRRHLVGPVTNVQGFGAKGDGAADDTRAIQAAIDSIASQGGGTVYIPAGTYRIMPQRDAAVGPAANALSIRSDNVRITGDGPQVSRLSFRVAGDRDPSDSFDIVYTSGQPTAWRGSAIAIEGTATTDRPRHDIVIENLEIDGGAYPGNTGDRTFPVPPETGAGWDITHKGIFIIPDRAYRRLRFANLHLHNFRGEIIYGGGDGIEDVVIEGCDLHSTNGDGISVGASQLVRDNRVYDCASACVENFHFAKEARYINNRFSQAPMGLVIQTNWNSSQPALISGNTFEECSNYGILMNVENGPTFITDNLFIDCGHVQTSDAAIMVTPDKGLTARIATGIVIRNNTILRQNRAGGFGIYLGCDDGRKLKSVVVSDNFIGSSGPAIERDLRFLAPIAYAFVGKPDVEGIFISDNVFFRTQRAVQNTVAHNPRAAAPMPLMWNNTMVGTSDNANSLIWTDGKSPIRLMNAGPTAINSSADGLDITPLLTPGDYASGQKLTITCDDAKRRVYIPQSSDIYECREGRFVSPGVFLTLECDGKKLFEVEHVDRRPRHYAEVMDGSIIEAQGHSTIYLSVPSERRFMAFSGIGHGAQVRLIATNNNVTIVHSDAIQLQAGTDYQMVTNEVKTFFRSRDGVLREV